MMSQGVLDGSEVEREKPFETPLSCDKGIVNHVTVTGKCILLALFLLDSSRPSALSNRQSLLGVRGFWGRGWRGGRFEGILMVLRLFIWYSCSKISPESNA
jgi:hypothetical protein